MVEPRSPLPPELLAQLEAEQVSRELAETLIKQCRHFEIEITFQLDEDGRPTRIWAEPGTGIDFIDLDYTQSQPLVEALDQLLRNVAKSRPPFSS